MCVDCAGFRPRGIRVGGIFPPRGMCAVRGMSWRVGFEGGGILSARAMCVTRGIPAAWDSRRGGILRRVGCARRVGFRALSFLTFVARGMCVTRAGCVVRGMPERAGFSTRGMCVVRGIRAACSSATADRSAAPPAPRRRSRARAHLLRRRSAGQPGPRWSRRRRPGRASGCPRGAARCMPAGCPACSRRTRAATSPRCMAAS